MDAPASQPRRPHNGDSLVTSVAWAAVGFVLIGVSVALSRAFVWFDESTRLVALTLIYMFGGIALLASLVVLRRTSGSKWLLAWIIAAGLVMRLVCFTQPPRFEDDYHRFLWDGAVTAHGINPYGLRPADVTSGRVSEERVKRLAMDAGPTLAKINHPHLSTIYPPVAQGFFAAAYFIEPFGANGLRAMILLVELAILAVLVWMHRRMSLPVHWLAIYWWCPIAVKELYVAAHMDALPAFFAIAAVAMVLTRYKKLAAVVLALGVGAKLWPLVLAPLVIRYGAKSYREMAIRTAIFATVSAVLCWPMLATAGDTSTSGPSAYASQWINNAGFFTVIHAGMNKLYESGVVGGFNPNDWARRTSGIIIMAGVIALCFVRLTSPGRLLRLAMWAPAGLFLLIPTQFPWYFVWCLPMLAVAPSPAILLYVALLPLYHLQYEYPWVLWVEHAPVWLMLLVGAFLRTGRESGETPAGETIDR